ncbi:MAG: hypothetical protein GBAus27B_000131 [Mycoplasmataceae bacterium]|nr:MAG: hypothetical protein GBAus27B_000131 [Mycoplasmataceae bacterium]
MVNLKSEGRNLQTLSITIKPNTYEDIKREIGKGKISKFIESIIEKEVKKIRKNKKNLNESMISYYKTCGKNLQEEDSDWEKLLTDVE